MTFTPPPKGGMCTACAHRGRDCSTLPFDQYRVIDRYVYNGQSVTIVKCAEFERSK